MKQFLKRLSPAALAFGGIWLSACGSSGTPTAAIIVSNQDLIDADQVTVDLVIALGPGLVVIYDDDGSGGLDDVLGSEVVSAGVSNDVTVDLNRSALDGETLHAVLHDDMGVAGTFEPETDPIAQDAAGDDVRAPFEINLVEPAVTASDQTLADLSTVVVVAEASHTANGWVVVTDSGDTVLGQTFIAAGVAANVSVALSRRAVNAETLTAALHDDFGTSGVFDGVGTDTVVGSVEDDFVVTVDNDVVPAVRVTVTNSGTVDYRWVSVEPSIFEGETVTSNTNDTALTLIAGWRYAIVNLAPTAHPFQFMDGSTILLSQGATAGTLEGDGDVDWSDSGGTVRFTFAGALAANADQYRCGVHTTMMFGTVATAP